MFVCLEVDTEDMIVWEKIDELLADEFLLTTKIWGVRDGKTPSIGQLPKNLFQGLTAYDSRQQTGASDLQDLISTRLKDIGVEEFVIFVFSNPTAWSRQTYEKPILNPVSIVEQQEITSREE